MEILILLFLGIVAGILAGLLGIGGGVVLVPMLVWVFHFYSEIPTANIMHLAIGTSLATICLTSISAMISHHRHHAVRWLIVLQFTPGIIIGGLLGAILAEGLSSDTLRMIFAIFIFLISAQLTFGLVVPLHYQLPNALGLSITGVVIGWISSLVGIGGGSLTVPFLLNCNIPIRNAVATSAACSFPIALSGTLGFLITGWHVNGLPKWTCGYIDCRALLIIALTSLIFAPLGAKLTYLFPVKKLKKLFALFLATVSINMLMN
jgi:uncharacterized protein